MTDLIKRLEALEAPCRECDCLIGVALGWFVTEPNKGWPDQLDYIDVRDGYRSRPGGGFDQLVPRFTASIDTAIDTALTLVDREHLMDVFNEARQMVSRKYSLHCSHWPEGKSFQYEFAIALCIAALRAQEARHD